MPGALGVGLAQLLVDRGEEREPDKRADELVDVLHRVAAAGAGVVPGCDTGMPFAQSGHAAGRYAGMSRLQSAWTLTSRLALPPDRSTSTAAPTTAPPAERTAATVSCTDPPVVMMSS